jgi:hypothetical protein
MHSGGLPEPIFLPKPFIPRIAEVHWNLFYFQIYPCIKALTSQWKGMGPSRLWKGSLLSQHWYYHCWGFRFCLFYCLTHSSLPMMYSRYEWMNTDHLSSNRWGTKEVSHRLYLQGAQNLDKKIKHTSTPKSQWTTHNWVGSLANERWRHLNMQLNMKCGGGYERRKTNMLRKKFNRQSKNWVWSLSQNQFRRLDHSLTRWVKAGSSKFYSGWVEHDCLVPMKWNPNPKCDMSTLHSKHCHVTWLHMTWLAHN